MTAPICPCCDEPVLPDDRRAPNFAQPTHYECGLRMVIGSLGHQRQRCFCYGGDEEDPPGMTRRQAAMAATLYYHFGKLPDDTTRPDGHEPGRTGRI